MISVIIPCFNQENYLADAIDSVLNQTVRPDEIIVIDDGSTDNSGHIADSYKDKVKVIHQVNKGLASARNTGIMNAVGEYIVPLDADDILQENCIKLVKHEIWEKDFPDVVMWDFKEFGIRNNEVRLTAPTLESIKTANRLAYCSAIKKSVLLEVGGYSPRMTFGWEDWHMWINLLSLDKTFVHIPEILFLYRTKEQSMITEANKHHEELMNQIKKDFPTLYA